ncbi:uncharacterized protein LOC128995657 [Macrosteles quadrilineatus]|uniref:uncharacterized protein LOC128995657 n=1 Tax=Macrosteles quadrilineatus TaxID=74068 RepID=UPI0023E27EA3|nr:uncharacterized protein LOC128995657 [Macrosteles quadrilineatus]
MTNVLRTLSKAAVTALSRPSTPSAMATVVQDGMSPLVSLTRGFAAPAAKLKKDCIKKRPTINCACARHPWPEDDKECEEVQEKPKDCDFDFRKLEVNPFDPPCDCQDPPPAAGCADVGRPKEICCRSFRQYGCHCEEEEVCEEEVEEVTHQIEAKTCELDFKKLEVNPYDDPCECRDAPPVARCADLPKKDLCCRTKKLFTCNCEAYDEPGLECLKQKVPKSKRTEAKKCDKKEWKGKCM